MYHDARSPERQSPLFCNISVACLLNYIIVRFNALKCYLKFDSCSTGLSFMTICSLCMRFPHIAIDFVLVVAMLMLYYIVYNKFCVPKRATCLVIIKVIQF